MAGVPVRNWAKTGWDIGNLDLEDQRVAMLDSERN
jgi:hypothetical protein